MGKIFLMIMENKCYQINTVNQNVLNTTLLLSSELMEHTIRKVQVNPPNLRFVQLEFQHYP